MQAVGLQFKSSENWWQHEELPALSVQNFFANDMHGYTEPFQNAAALYSCRQDTYWNVICIGISQQLTADFGNLSDYEDVTNGKYTDNKLY